MNWLEKVDDQRQGGSVGWFSFTFGSENLSSVFIHVYRSLLDSIVERQIDRIELTEYDHTQKRNGEIVFHQGLYDSPHAELVARTSNLARRHVILTVKDKDPLVGPHLKIVKNTETELIVDIIYDD